VDDAESVEQFSTAFSPRLTNTFWGVVVRSPSVPDDKQHTYVMVDTQCDWLSGMFGFKRRSRLFNIHAGKYRTDGKSKYKKYKH